MHFCQRDTRFMIPFSKKAACVCLIHAWTPAPYNVIIVISAQVLFKFSKQVVIWRFYLSHSLVWAIRRMWKNSPAQLMYCFKDFKSCMRSNVIMLQHYRLILQTCALTPHCTLCLFCIAAQLTLNLSPLFQYFIKRISCEQNHSSCSDRSSAYTLQLACDSSKVSCHALR